MVAMGLAPASQFLIGSGQGAAATTTWQELCRKNNRVLHLHVCACVRMLPACRRLAEGKEGSFVPYRNSKLTRLLQPCLGGNARTGVIAVINPAAEQIEETFNTLLFASRAMNVVNTVRTARPRESEKREVARIGGLPSIRLVGHVTPLASHCAGQFKIIS